MRNPFRYFNSSPEIFRLAVMMYIHSPLSLRQVEDLLHERGIDICQVLLVDTVIRMCLVTDADPEAQKTLLENSRKCSECHILEVRLYPPFMVQYQPVKWSMNLHPPPVHDASASAAHGGLS